MVTMGRGAWPVGVWVRGFELRLEVPFGHKHFAFGRACHDVPVVDGVNTSYRRRDFTEQLPQA